MDDITQTTVRAQALAMAVDLLKANLEVGEPTKVAARLEHYILHGHKDNDAE